MAFDPGLAQRVREAFDGWVLVDERRMFGGLAFMYRSHMTVGILGERLMVRAGPDAYEHALSLPHVSPMDFTGKPLKGMVMVAVAGLESDADLLVWLHRAMAYVETLPDKR